MPGKYEQVWSFDDLAYAIAQEEEAHGIKIDVRFTVGKSDKTLVLAIYVFDAIGFTEMGCVHQEVIRTGKDSSRLLCVTTRAVRALETHWRASPWTAPKLLRSRLTAQAEERPEIVTIPRRKF